MSTDDTTPETNQPAPESTEGIADDTQTKADGPMTSLLKTGRTFPDRTTRRSAKRHGIGPEAIARETADRVEESRRRERMKQLPDDVRDLLSKITTPEVLARTKGTPLHSWTRSDTLDLFFTLGLVHAKMVEPLPAEEGDPIPPAVRLVQAGGGVGVFYPVTDDSTSHVLVTVNDPRDYLSGADRDLIDDMALDALNGLAERIIMGVYSLAMSMIPGSDAHEIAELMGALNEINETPAS